MSLKTLQAWCFDRRKSRKNKNPQEPEEALEAIDGSAPSALAVNVIVIAPTPRHTLLSTIRPSTGNLNGDPEQTSTFQTSHTGGAFGKDVPPSEVDDMVDNARSGVGSSSRMDSASTRRESITLPSRGECEEVAAQERASPIFIPSSSGLGVPISPHALTPTDGGLTTCDDGGHDFEAEFLKKHPDLIVARDYSRRCPVVEHVRDDLNARGTKIQSATDSKSWFIPCTSLHQIMTYKTVCLLLRECNTEDWHDEQISQYAEKIAPPLDDKYSTSFRRIFAILVLIRKPAAIFDFLQAEIDDSKLPSYFDSDGRLLSTFLRTCRWKDQDIRDFCQAQWEVWPVFFSVQGEKVVHYECRPGEILPFVKHEWKVNKKGGYGEVACYALHTHQQSLNRYTKDGAKRPIAVKKLYRPNSRKEFDTEQNMLDRLTPLDTPHLAKLLATYEVPKDSDKQGSKDYFLMFECADSTLSDLWAKPPSPVDELPMVAKWVASQSQGLATALAMIHDFKEYQGKDDLDDRTHGFHGDIKPDNVLLYNNWVGQEHELGVLQITDFGLSSFHHTQTAADIKIRHQAGDYRPPESQMVLNISVSFDVWTLGCLSLEFLTWLVEGPDGLKEFLKRRESRGFTYSKHTCFWEVTEKDNVTTVSLSEPILKWATYLCRSPNSSQFVRDFCELIINRMLVIEDKGIQGQYSNSTQMDKQKIPPTTRIGAAELAEELQKFVNKDIHYYEPSPPQDQLNLDRQRHCIKVPKPVHQLLEEAEKRLDPQHQELSNRQLAQLNARPEFGKRDKSPARLWIEVKEKIHQIRHSVSPSRNPSPNLNPSGQPDG